MRAEYAIELRDASGHTRRWFDAYPTLQMARRDARELVRSSPAWCVAHILKKAPGAGIGAQWREVGKHQ